MNRSELRNRLNQFWQRADVAADARKDSHSAVFVLEDLYRDLTAEERSMADEVIVEWVLSEDDRKRFDGLALVDEFSIQAALPALRVLSDRFEHAEGPSAPYDWAKINRIIGWLTSGLDPSRG